MRKFNNIVQSEVEPSINDIWFKEDKLWFFNNGKWDTLIDEKGEDVDLAGVLKESDIGKKVPGITFKDEVPTISNVAPNINLIVEAVGAGLNGSFIRKSQLTRPPFTRTYAFRIRDLTWDNLNEWLKEDATDNHLITSYSLRSLFKKIFYLENSFYSDRRATISGVRMPHMGIYLDNDLAHKSAGPFTPNIGENIYHMSVYSLSSDRDLDPDSYSVVTEKGLAAQFEKLISKEEFVSTETELIKGTKLPALKISHNATPAIHINPTEVTKEEDSVNVKVHVFHGSRPFEPTSDSFVLETGLNSVLQNYPKLSDGLIPSQYLPSYVDDVLEYDTFLDFPLSADAEEGKIYVDKEENRTYRWSGTQYTEIGKSLSLGETASTAYPGDKGKENYDAINGIIDILNGLDDRFARVDEDGKLLYDSIKWSTTVGNRNYTARESVDTFNVVPTKAADGGTMTKWTFYQYRGDRELNPNAYNIVLENGLAKALEDYPKLREDGFLPSGIFPIHSSGTPAFSYEANSEKTSPFELALGTDNNNIYLRSNPFLAYDGSRDLNSEAVNLVQERGLSKVLRSYPKLDENGKIESGQLPLSTTASSVNAIWVSAAGQNTIFRPLFVEENGEIKIKGNLYLYHGEEESKRLPTEGNWNLVTENALAEVYGGAHGNMFFAQLSDDESEDDPRDTIYWDDPGSRTLWFKVLWDNKPTENGRSLVTSRALYRALQNYAPLNDNNVIASRYLPIDTSPILATFSHAAVNPKGILYSKMTTSGTSFRTDLTLSIYDGQENSNRLPGDNTNLVTERALAQEVSKLQNQINLLLGADPGGSTGGLTTSGVTELDYVENDDTNKVGLYFNTKKMSQIIVNLLTDPGLIDDPLTSDIPEDYRFVTGTCLGYFKRNMTPKVEVNDTKVDTTVDPIYFQYDDVEHKMLCSLSIVNEFAKVDESGIDIWGTHSKALVTANAVRTAIERFNSELMTYLQVAPIQTIVSGGATDNTDGIITYDWLSQSANTFGGIPVLTHDGKDNPIIRTSQIPVKAGYGVTIDKTEEEITINVDHNTSNVAYIAHLDIGDSDEVKTTNQDQIPLDGEPFLVCIDYGVGTGRFIPGTGGAVTITTAEGTRVHYKINSDYSISRDVSHFDHSELFYDLGSINFSDISAEQDITMNIVDPVEVAMFKKTSNLAINIHTDQGDFEVTCPQVSVGPTIKTFNSPDIVAGNTEWNYLRITANIGDTISITIEAN